jgi:hypothetical protein
MIGPDILRLAPPTYSGSLVTWQPPIRKLTKTPSPGNSNRGPDHPRTRHRVWPVSVRLERARDTQPVAVARRAELDRAEPSWRSATARASMHASSPGQRICSTRRAPAHCKQDGAGHHVEATARRRPHRLQTRRAVRSSRRRSAHSNRASWSSVEASPKTIWFSIHETVRSPLLVDDR